MIVVVAVDLCDNMSLTVDSKPYFESRAKSIGFNDAQLAALAASGVDSMAAMTFYCNYQPSAVDDKPLIDAVTKTFGADPPEPQVLIMIRRLHFEAHAIFLSDMKSRVTATEDDAPKKIPVAERASRHATQQAKLSGIRLEGEMECSHSLLDTVMQQFERNELKHVPLNLCTSRDQEQSGHKKDSQLVLDGDGQIKVKPGTSLAKADTSTDFRIYQAFNRRGVAYDQANLMEYMVHLKWVDYLFSAMQRRVPDNFNPVSLQQVLTADRELWKRLADETRAGICPDVANGRPLDAAMATWSTHPEVLFFLLPTPSSSGSKRDNDGGKGSYSRADNGRQYQDRRSSPKGKGNYFKGGKGKGKGDKGKQYNAFTALPSGCVSQTDDGNRLCFGFNSSRGCTYAKVGDKCSRGVHLCARAGCFGKHSALACTKAAN